MQLHTSSGAISLSNDNRSADKSGSPDGEFQGSFETAWESLLLVAYGTKRSA